MHKLRIVAGSVFVIALLAVPAHAHRPLEDVFEVTAVECTFQDAVAGIVSVQAEPNRTFGGASVWLSGDLSTGEPDLIGDGDHTEVEIVGTSVVANIPLLDAETLESSGLVLTFEAILTGPLGEPFTFSDRFRDGNRWVEISVSSQPLGVTGGTVSIDGLTVVADCNALRTTEVTYVTNPDTLRISLDSESFVECLAPSDVGATLYLNASELDRDGILYLEIYSPGTVPFQDPPQSFGLAEFSALRGKHDLEVTLFDPLRPDEDPVGTAHLFFTVTVGDRVSSRVMLQNINVKEVLTTLEAEGTVTAGDSTFALEGACNGQHFTAKGVNTSANGPQPKGKPPVNDTPAGALLLPAKEVVSTRSATLAPELPWLEVVEGTVFEFPWGRTIWYQVVGTGQTVAIDTAGSDFDTVIAVYAGEAFEQVMLADDGMGANFSFQAALSFFAEPGTTYYIQIGGFAGEFGQLLVTAE